MQACEREGRSLLSIAFVFIESTSFLEHTYNVLSSSLWFSFFLTAFFFSLSLCLVLSHSSPTLRPTPLASSP